jgi:hypothetical protein
MAGVICGSRICAVAGAAADGRPSLSGAPTWPICPAAPAGCWCAISRARERLVTRIDPGEVSLVAELRGHEQQAAEELGQAKLEEKYDKRVTTVLLKASCGPEPNRR